MAEASTVTPVLSDKNSQNGAAGPSSSTDNSIAEEVSIHLSPRGPRKTSSPRVPKPVNRTTSVVKSASQLGKTGMTRKPSSIKRTESVKEKSQKQLTKSSDQPQEEKCDMCDEIKAMKARFDTNIVFRI